MSGIGNLPPNYKETEKKAFEESGANFSEYFDTKGSGYEKVDSKSSADSFRSRFASNMAEYFKDNPDAFKFDEGSVGDRSAKFADQFGGSFDEVAEGFGIFQPRTNPMSTIPGTPGQPGLLQQIAGPVAGAATQAFFACDLNLKHDIDYLTDMDLVKDDLAEVAYFVKELQDS